MTAACWPGVDCLLAQGCASSRVLGRAGLGGWLGLKWYLAWGGGVGGGLGAVFCQFF